MKNRYSLFFLTTFFLLLLISGCSTEGCNHADCPEFLEIGMEVENCCFYSSDVEIPLFEENDRINLEMEPGNVEDVEIEWYHATGLSWTSNLWGFTAMGLRSTRLAVDEDSQVLIFQPGDELIPGEVIWEAGLKNLAEVHGAESYVEHWPWDGEPYGIGVRNFYENGDLHYGWVILSLDSTRAAPVVIHEWAMQR